MCDPFIVSDALGTDCTPPLQGVSVHTSSIFRIVELHTWTRTVGIHLVVLPIQGHTCRRLRRIDGVVFSSSKRVQTVLTLTKVSNIIDNKMFVTSSIPSDPRAPFATTSASPLFPLERVRHSNITDKGRIGHGDILKRSRLVSYTAVSYAAEVSSKSERVARVWIFSCTI